MGRLPVLSPWAAILFIGALIGWSASAAVGMVLQDNALFGSGEPSEARAFMIAELQQDPDAVNALQLRGSIVERATQYQNLDPSKPADVKPLSVTYLGGGGTGRVSVHMYAIELLLPDGRVIPLPVKLVLVGGKVIPQ